MKGVSLVLHPLVDGAWRYRGCSGIAKKLQQPPVIVPGHEGRRDEARVLAGYSASMRKEALPKATEETPEPSSLNNK